MSDPNPYESSTASGDGAEQVSLHRQMQRGSYAVLAIALGCGLWAIAYLIGGVSGLVANWTRPPAAEEGLSSFLDQVEVFERSYFISGLVRGAALTFFAGVLFHYARLLRAAGGDSVSPVRLARAQNWCWYTAAALLLGYFGRQLGLPVLSWF
ncbi:MAG: hypothetical protein SFU86_05720 [Pirellulaceae bacterium]|nr:hypothetical protein [Pirellulaceae bacterium]